MNRNTLWSEIFVDELARSGLQAVCAAPGSRHTPLMLAFAKHPDIKVYSHLDERSASFFALGLALASDAPVALICTSGTAGANMYPAIIEAHQSRVPLIVITADRPPELRHSGANQTIDQIKMFGDFVLWFVDMALPEANPPALAIRNLRTTANRAYAKANGIRKGVVHLNMPFRKPLEPVPVEGDVIEIPKGAEVRDNSPYVTTSYHVGGSSYTHHIMFEAWEKYERGLIIAGLNASQDRPESAGNSFLYALQNIQITSGYPILVDSFSQGRFNRGSLYIGGYETFLKAPLEDLEADVIIRLGDMPLSANLNSYLNRINPKYDILLASHGEWSDDSHTLTHFFQKPGCVALLELDDDIREKYGTKFRRESEWKSQFALLEKATWETIEAELDNSVYFDAAVVYDIVELIPDSSTLFVGNSLPVRHLDQFGKPSFTKQIYAIANRGASGIDGNISSALGAGAARPDKPLVAIVGDITFYHDMNGLLAVQRCGVPVTIVLLNNDGGGIFNRLPIKNFEPEFTDYFLTPHGLDFSHAAKMYGLDYVPIDAYEQGAREAFRQAFSTSVGSGKSTIIEVRTDSRKDEARRQEIVAAVHARLQALNL